MSSSLRDLLSQELRHPSSSAAAPLRRSSSSAAPTRRRASVDQTPSPTPEDAASAAVAVLSAYSGRFLKDPAFRRRLRDSCSACIGPAAQNPLLANLNLGIDSIERLALDGEPTRDAKIRSLRNSIRLLSVVASLNSPKGRSDGGSASATGGVPNSILSACAHMYLAVVYRIEKNDRVSARHLLQVFVDAPYIARRKLLPDLWDHFLLPHLLHLKVWYCKEVEVIESWEVGDRELKLKALNRCYNDQMDVGTAQFARYYKEWIKVGGKAPPIPTVSLPAMSSYLEPGDMRPVSISHSSINQSLYRAVFGTPSHGQFIEDGLMVENLKLTSERGLDSKEGNATRRSLQSDMGVDQTSIIHKKPTAVASPVPRKSHSFRLFSCRALPDTASIHHAQTPKKESAAVAQEPEKHDVSVITPSGAIDLISKSDNLKECEIAVNVISRTWLDSNGDGSMVKLLSSSSFIEGLLEVTFTSKNNNVLELSISILAELVTRNEVIRQIILSADPQLEIFLKLLRNNHLFLKTSIVLYLLKPKAKQMLSLDWIPLVLRVLDYGEEEQTLFTVQCCPRSAAFYLLDQLLMGFDVDRNVENAKQLVSLGGVDLLMRGLETGNARERRNCASLLARCVRAEGSCREYLATNIKKKSIIQLLLGNQLKSNGNVLSLLSELLCLNRITMTIKFLKELKNDSCLNVMHVLLVYLQQAPPEQQPLAAALLLQLDLLGDPLQSSIYREEAIDAFIAAMERASHSRKVQDQCSRALLLLAGRFSCTGESTAEAWLLRRAGFDFSPSASFRSKEIFINDNVKEEQETTTEEWLRKMSIILLTSGNKRFFVALSNCIADGIPNLARSCLVTVAWISSSLASLQTTDSLQSLACSILAPCLFESLSYDRAQEERVLASLSLFNFVRNPECLPNLFPLEKETISSLQDLAQITWTAKELLFACCM